MEPSIKRLTLDKNCKFAEEGIYTFHSGLRAGSQMTKCQRMIQSARETLKQCSLLPGEVTAYISMHASDGQKGHAPLILRAAFVVNTTDEIVGGCDYPVAAMEELGSLESIVTSTLEAEGFSDVQTIRLISMMSKCSGCGEDLYLVPDPNSPEGTDLHHASSIDEEKENHDVSRQLH